MNKIIILLLIGMALILMQACGSSAKEADLPVRKSCNLERLYKDMPQNIRTDTPALAFVNALCAGKADEVAALFREKKLFWDERPAVDAPYGRFEGLDGIRSFAKGFLTKFKATSAYRKPIFKPAHYEMGDPGLLTGAMRAYYEALHHAPYCNPDKIHAAFADECIVGGYDPWGTPSSLRKRCRRMPTSSAMA